MSVFKRKVFYLSGFDPRGVRFYHQLYRESAARYAAKSGDVVDVSSRIKLAPHSAGWQIENHTQDCTTDYEFLRWEDIVNDRWERNPIKLGMLVARTYYALFRWANWPKAFSLPRGPLVTLFYPLVLTVLLPLLLWCAFSLALGMLLPKWVAMISGLVLAVLAARWILTAIKAPWLLRFFTFNHTLSHDHLDADLDARLDMFAQRIRQECDKEWDEILLIAHSNGGILSLLLLQKLLEQDGYTLPASFRFITLGHSIPLLAARDKPNVVITALHALASQNFTWIDIGSPPDGAGYHGVDCFALVGAKELCPPVLLSPRFHLFYDAATYHKGMHNKYEIHFDYLRVGDRLSPLDIINITASARSFDHSLSLFQALK